MNPVFHRLQLVVGEPALADLQNTKVLIVGVGGVGSWCAEGLVRSGIGKITIIDSDQVCVTNINRQLMATARTVGKSKVEVLKARLLEINPRCEVTAVEAIYDEESSHLYDCNAFDYVIDAIDSLQPKIHLITKALASTATLFSAMGAACKLDPTRIKVADINKSFGCRLAKLMRKRLRRAGVLGKFKVVFSDEVLPVQEGTIGCGTGNCVCPPKRDEEGNIIDSHEWCSTKKQINGSVVHMTGIFGFYLTSMVINDLMEKYPEIKSCN